MSLRWSSHVAPKPPKGGGAKTQNGRFSSKIALLLKKVCYEVSLCENYQRQSCRAFIGHAKWLVGTSPSTWNFGSNYPPWSEIADFPSIFARSASAVTRSEKSSVNTNRKSTTRFPISLRWSSYVAPKSPKGWLKNAKCPKFEHYAATSPKRYEIGCQLLLITNRKSHTGFRLVPTSMTLDDLERRNNPYFAFFRRFRFLCWPNTSQWLNTDLYCP